MLIIPREKAVLALGKDQAPAARAKSGETVRFETRDSYGDQLKSEDQLFSDINQAVMNPATGPLYVEEAEPGDMLKVGITEITLRDYGVMAPRPGKGVFGALYRQPRTKIVPIRDGQAIFNAKISIPINPMVGVIGVAPPGDPIKTTVPDSHGGNMDCRKIVQGAVVYLPVLVRGALLSMGDIHALMGDGETVICGLEMAGAVTVKVDVIKGKELPLPIVANGREIMTVASKATLDEASREAALMMLRFLMGELGMDEYEAGMLLSLVGNMAVCQVVDPLMTARMELPRWILEKYGYEMA